MHDEQNETQRPWFWKLVLNNKLVSILSVILLVLLIILVASQVSFIFTPIHDFILIIGTPMLISGILYYLLNPIVNWVERKLHMPRTVGIMGLFIIVLALIVWGLVMLVPEIQTQFFALIDNIPHYWKTISTSLQDLFRNTQITQIQDELNKISSNVYSELGKIGKNLFSQGLSGLSGMVSVITTICVSVVTVPFIVFYLLRDGTQLAPFILKYLPPKFRKPTYNVLHDINVQVASYIRGQILIAVAVGCVYMIGFSIIGLDYAVVFGVVAGFLNIIPYLGSWLTMVPVVIIAFVTAGPIMVVKVIIVHLIEQLIESRVLQPVVIGSQLSIHPLTIIFVILTAGKLFGILGVVLGIPGYATLKVIVIHFYEWYRTVSPLYHEEKESVSET